MTDEFKTQPWDREGLTPRERMDILIRRYNGLVRACDKQTILVDKLMREKEKMSEDIAQINAELTASRADSVTLAMEINGAGKADREEVMRLRNLLKANDILIGG